MFKLLLQSLIELFLKCFNALARQREINVKNKTASYSHSLSHTSLQSDFHQQLNQLAEEHHHKSGFLLLENNLDAFQARSYLIHHAEKTLDLQYYYFHGDTSGHLIAQLLLQAAERGVRVRLLLDDIDTLGADEPIQLLNSHQNIEIRIFNPFKFRSLLRYIEFITDFSRVGRRMHNKALIVDSRLAILGGRNIGDIYFAADPDLLFVDVDILSMGSIVFEISLSFDEYWNSPWSIPVEDLYVKLNPHKAVNKIKSYLKKYVQQVKQIEYIKALDQSKLGAYTSLKDLPLVWSDAYLFYDKPSKVDGVNQEEQRQIKINLRRLIDLAKREVLFVSPYLVPGDVGVNWFKSLVDRGIEVTILTNSLAATDVIAAHSGYKKYREALLKAGVKLFELKASAYVRERKHFKMLRVDSRTSLHAKTIIIDREKAFIGSPNFDPRSTDINTEIGLLINNAALAGEVVELFLDVCASKNSYQLYFDDATNKVCWRGWNKKLSYGFMYEPDAGVFRHFLCKLFALFPLDNYL